jgi:hypothetical protein
MGITPYRSVLFLLRHVCGTSAARLDGTGRPKGGSSVVAELRSE